LTPMPLPPKREVTPVFVIVIAPVGALTLVPVPAVKLVTPAFVRVRVPPNATGLPPTVIPVPVTVIELLSKFVFGMAVGKSVTTRARNVGAAAAPVVGPAKNLFAD
jgi:hypothetical protein